MLTIAIELHKLLLLKIFTLSRSVQNYPSKNSQNNDEVLHTHTDQMDGAMTTVTRVLYPRRYSNNKVRATAIALPVPTRS